MLSHDIGDRFGSAAASLQKPVCIGNPCDQHDQVLWRERQIRFAVRLDPLLQPEDYRPNSRAQAKDVPKGNIPSLRQGQQSKRSGPTSEGSGSSAAHQRRGYL